jgi:hypothetical protein
MLAMAREEFGLGDLTALPRGEVPIQSLVHVPNLLFRAARALH